MCLSAACVFASSAWPADSSTVMDVGRFSAGQPGRIFPEGWKPLTFKKVPRLTQYELVLDSDGVVVKATSERSASGLTKEVKIDPAVFPIVRWHWKVENLLEHSDVNHKGGDDYPARLYVTFEYDPQKVSFANKLKFKAGQALFGDIPIAALNYIWDTHARIGTVVDNAYTDFAKMIVVESGPAKVGKWVQETRNLYDDYKRAFGEEPPLINGIAIMTDTDNTNERAIAYYGDIQFMRAGEK